MLFAERESKRLTLRVVLVSGFTMRVEFAETTAQRLSVVLVSGFTRRLYEERGVCGKPAARLAAQTPMASAKRLPQQRQAVIASEAKQSTVRGDSH
ncbi:MAG: hypothetical protein LBF83_04785 [Spirochaetaceae bacterium]|nr:hypothetical protein [Spirochaetaceae bacterium]